MRGDPEAGRVLGRAKRWGQRIVRGPAGRPNSPPREGSGSGQRRRAQARTARSRTTPALTLSKTYLFERKFPRPEMMTKTVMVNQERARKTTLLENHRRMVGFGRTDQVYPG